MVWASIACYAHLQPLLVQLAILAFTPLIFVQLPAANLFLVLNYVLLVATSMVNTFLLTTQMWQFFCQAAAIATWHGIAGYFWTLRPA